MTLPASGPISLGDVNVELGVSATAIRSMNEASTRTLFGVGGSGTTISMSQGYGKSNVFAVSITSNQTNLDLRTYIVAAGWNGTTKPVVTINSGIVISSNAGSAAMSIAGPFPNSVSLINNGTIVGLGGTGGGGGGVPSPSPAGLPGAGGGLAMSVSTPLTLTNNGTIAGGGGGGGGGGNFQTGPLFTRVRYGGGGGGGGRSSLTNAPGGAGGVSTNATGSPGGTGTFSAAGAAGAGSNGNPGGAGGGWGAAGAAGAAGTNGPGAGGGGGTAITGNPSITYITTGTILGAIT